MTPAATARHLRRGGIVAVPTEGVWGLSVDPRQPKAVARLLWLKRRDWRKGLILATDRRARLAGWVRGRALVRATSRATGWPGPVTWVMPAGLKTYPRLRGGVHTIAVRVSAHAPLAGVARALGRPLVSTSANRAGRPAATSARAVRHAFPARTGVRLVSGKTGGRAGPSAIRRWPGGELLRAG